MSNFYGLLGAFCFDVEINGLLIGFKAVRGIRLAAAFEPLAVGGMNDGPVMLPAPVKEGGKITLERGKYTAITAQLPRPGTTLNSMTILLYGDDDHYRAAYILQSPVVESIELGVLDALSSELVIETLTVSFRSILERNY